MDDVRKRVIASSIVGTQHLLASGHYDAKGGERRRKLDRRPSKPATPRPGFTFDRVPTDIELVEAVDDALACRMLLGSTARTLGT